MTQSSYPTVNIPENVFERVLQELENFAGWRWCDGQEDYSASLRMLVKQLESYQSSPTSVRDEDE